jgi:hypothetical protein
VGQRGRFAGGLAYCAAIPGTRNKLKCYEAVGEQIGALRNLAPDRTAACEPAPPTC